MKKYIVEVNNSEYEVSIREKDEKGDTVVANTQGANNNTSKNEMNENKSVNSNNSTNNVNNNKDISMSGSEKVSAPMSGKILSIRANEGENVDKNQVIMTLEAMKMETEIVAPESGKVSNILVSEGDKCKQGDNLALIEAGGN